MKQEDEIRRDGHMYEWLEYWRGQEIWRERKQ